MIINTQTSPSIFSTAATQPGKATSAGTGVDSTTQADSFDNSLAVAQNNLSAALSPLKDGDAANATLASLRQSLMNQPAQALMAQAYSLRPSALQLLQQ